MKCYLITTATVFGVHAGFHIWRASIEGMRLIREPLFLGLTLAAIALCCWGCCLLVRYSPSCFALDHLSRVLCPKPKRSSPYDSLQGKVSAVG